MTDEGLTAATERPRGFTCPNQREEPWKFEIGQSADGWHQPFRYESDSTTYRISASHDYYVTDKSPPPYWENLTGGASMPPLDFYHWYEFFLWLALVVTGNFLLITRSFFLTRVPVKVRRTFGILTKEIAIGLLIVAFVWFIARPNY